MRIRVFGFTVLALALAVLIGLPLAQAQMQSLSKRNASWENQSFVTPPGGDPVDDDEGDDEECDCPPYPAPVAATGQTVSHWPADDGDLRNGVSVTPQFTDNGDGTVSDNRTGLIWLRRADCLHAKWSRALMDTGELGDGQCGLTDGSVPGDWRVPNVREFQSVIDYGQESPALPPGHPFVGVQSDSYPLHAGYYWTSTGLFGASRAYRIHMRVGTTGFWEKEAWSMWVWPVRGPE